jgi:ABC-type amino acid transport system permease subunit
MIVFLLLALLVTIVPSHFIALALYKKLVSTGNKYAMAIRISVFIVSFCMIAFILFLIIINNVRFER